MNKLLKKLKEMEQTSKGMIDAQVEGMEFYRKTVNQLLTLNEENLDESEKKALQEKVALMTMERILKATAPFIETFQASGLPNVLEHLKSRSE